MGHTRIASLALLVLLLTADVGTRVFALDLEEATVEQIQGAFKAGTLTSRALVEFYLQRIAQYNPILHAIIEVNPDALALAHIADTERQMAGGYIGGLHGIPILVKDTIATLDKLNTTAGSFALLGSIVPRDAGVVSRLRRAGAIILGKANLSEWANFRSAFSGSSGWSARGGQTKDPYVLSATPCGSSSGSAAGTAANLAAISLGTETDGSILCPASRNALVGIKPTVGLTSRAGVVPVSHHQDTIGPLCRTVADAVAVLEQIVGCDERDPATERVSHFIPREGYKQFLIADGLKEKRLGVLRNPFFDADRTLSDQSGTVDSLITTLRNQGAHIVDNVTIPGTSEILGAASEIQVLIFDFKQDLNEYLAGLVQSPVRTLADVIVFNNEHANEEELNLYDQAIFIASNSTTGFQSKVYQDALKRDHFLTQHGIHSTLDALGLDALIAPSESVQRLVAIAGYPGISVPAGYDKTGVPYGIGFIGRRGSEPTLIEIAYAFEQATKVRKPPQFLQ